MTPKHPALTEAANQENLVAHSPCFLLLVLHRFVQATWLPWLFVIKPLITYKLGGMEMLAWAMAVPMVYGWHVTFLVNSAAHVWGCRPYNTGTAYH